MQRLRTKEKKRAAGARQNMGVASRGAGRESRLIKPGERNKKRAVRLVAEPGNIVCGVSSHRLGPRVSSRTPYPNPADFPVPSFSPAAIAILLSSSPSSPHVPDIHLLPARPNVAQQHLRTA